MKIERKDGKLLVTVSTKPNVDDQRDPHQPFPNRFRGGEYSAVLSETEDLSGRWKRLQLELSQFSFTLKRKDGGTISEI